LTSAAPRGTIERMDAADFAPILRDPDPIEVAEREEARAAEAEGPCDRCGLPVLPEESCHEFERRMAAAEARAVPLRYALGGCRHVLCSPSRAQYLPGQPRSEEFPYVADKEGLVRQVWAGMRADAGLAVRR
jgi:hypothetical protein